MNSELKRAQKTLTEQKIRKFWTAMTLSFPTMCVQNGVQIDYKKPIDQNMINHMATQLIKCSSKNVATPLFQYNYDPPNSTPHHVSALTLTQLPGEIILSLFDPKGKGMIRKREELSLVLLLAKTLERDLRKKVTLKVYNGYNLQQRDSIGLCQLFSLYYLYEYMVGMTNKKSIHNIHVFTDPNKFVQYIRHTKGHFNEENLFTFWKTFFT
jgi:hypothetical protein